MGEGRTKTAEELRDKPVKTNQSLVSLSTNLGVITAQFVLFSCFYGRVKVLRNKCSQESNTLLEVT